MRYRNIDLNLFALFEALLKHRSVSAAANELGVTASAASHGLARLRKLLDDELFVRGPTGLQLTPRAGELAPTVAQGLGMLAAALEQRGFDPADTVRTFVIAATDYMTTLVLPGLVPRLARAAPGAHLKVFPCGRTDVVQHLDDGRVDVVLGWFDALPVRIGRQSLATESEALVVRAGHPLLKGKLTRERILRYPHAVVELTGSENQASGGFFDDKGAFRRTWIECLIIEEGTRDGGYGRVAVTVPHYADIALVLPGTDMVATLPRRLALRVAEQHALVLLDLPYEPAEVLVEMIWHERSASDPGLRWLFGQMQAALERGNPA